MNANNPAFPAGLRSSERGTALVEFAVFLSVFMLLFIGMVDYTLAIQQSIQISEAASAGAAYGAIPGKQKDFTGMTNAAKAAAPGLSNLSVTAANVFSCTPGGAAVANTGSCSSYGTPIEYVVVNTSATVPPLIAWAGVTSTFPMKGSAKFRVPWTP